jgi:hypothetical protein
MTVTRALVGSLALLGVVGCYSPTDPVAREDSLQPGEPYELVLKIGNDVVVPGSLLRVTFVRVTEDSRCPADVTCVWEGNGGVEVGLALGSGPTVPYVLNTSLEPRAVSHGPYTVTLLTLAPHPVSTSTIDDSQYELGLRVEL